MKCVILLGLISNIIITIQDDNILIDIAQGKIRGVRRDGCISFIGIPYASLEGPNNRFKRAGPAPSWLGVREGSHERLSCYSKYSAIEDCLQLDVHVPSDTLSTALPVLVWVQSGSGTYNPITLVNKGIIFVAVSYRVGPLGFLCLNNENVSGNAGVKDLVLSLRWIGDNIIAFRGNPSRIVIAGHGFGAALVEALIFSSTANNLFHGAIMQSGSALCPWAFNYDAEERARLLTKSLTKSDNEEEIINTLFRMKPGEIMLKATKLNLPYFPFGICAEIPHKKEELFLSEPPIKILKEKNFTGVPLIVGFNSEEAYIFDSYLIYIKALKKLRNNISIILPEELLFSNYNELKEISKQVKDLYFSSNITLAAILRYHRDVYFVNHIHRSARLHANHLPVYYYQFSYNGQLGVKLEDGVKKTGAAHSDELAYLFPQDGKSYGGDDGDIQERLLHLWSNFVKHLNPNPSSKQFAHWEPLRPQNPRLYDINIDMQMKDFPHDRATQFWDEVYEKYYYRRQNI